MFVNLIIMLLCFLCSWNLTLAQDQVSQSGITPGSVKILIVPAGTALEGRIDTKIGSAISHAGQAFLITMSSPVLANGSIVLIPAGAQIVGEVVEAIPASHVYYRKGMAKPLGKLRVELTMLRLPDGTSYPLVASLTGESFGSNRRHTTNPNLGKGVGYIGSENGFQMVAPRSSYNNMGRQPQVVSRDQMLRDPVYGSAPSQQAMSMYGGAPAIRSLVRKGQNLVIYSGSPLSIKLDAPLKLPFMQTSNASVPNTTNDATQNPATNKQTPSPVINQPPPSVPVDNSF